MRNETISRILGAAVGAAMILAALAAFSPRSTTIMDDLRAKPSVARVASLHASETVNVYSRD